MDVKVRTYCKSTMSLENLHVYCKYHAVTGIAIGGLKVFCLLNTSQIVCLCALFSIAAELYACAQVRCQFFSNWHR